MNASFTLQLFYLLSAVSGKPVEGVEHFEPCETGRDIVDDWEGDPGRPRAWGACAGPAPS